MVIPTCFSAVNQGRRERFVFIRGRLNDSSYLAVLKIEFFITWLFCIFIEFLKYRCDIKLIESTRRQSAHCCKGDDWDTFLSERRFHFNPTYVSPFSATFLFIMTNRICNEGAHRVIKETRGASESTSVRSTDQRRSSRSGSLISVGSCPAKEGGNLTV